jgi:DNA mismatch repair protein MutL
MPDPRVWILPAEVAERIAAGEVVERPASVVKELVENALDAGAGRIQVETEAGGKALLRVTDDGQGMTADEAQLALQRHATSKIRSADDLFNIRTLGFRGEALPSIAAVSDLEILTRTPDATEGTRLAIRGGLLSQVEPAPAKVGTAITVRSLFFNVPVREKFLRSDAAESNQITEWIQRFALSRPDVGFRLTHEGREALLSPGSQDPLNAVVAVLGRPVARDLLRLQPPVGTAVDPLSSRPTPSTAHPTPIQVTGFVGRPTLTRSNRGMQHIYVNGRSVRAPLVYRALDDAFRASMPHGRHPVAVLFIEVPPDAVDVNVHPAKTEVRFQDEQAVQAAIIRAVQAALRSDASHASRTGPLEFERPHEGAPPPGLRVAEPGSPPQPPPAVEPGQLPFADTTIGGPAPPNWRDPGRRSGSLPPSYRWETGRVEPPAGSGAAHASPAAGETLADLGPPDVSGSPDAAGRPADVRIGELRPLGQIQDLFILAEGAGGFWIIDQHVAHERVLFDRMLEPGSVAEPSEALLIPATIDVDRAQAIALDEHREQLAELGFLIEPFGPGRYSLRSVPRTLVGRNYEAVFQDLADELAEQSRGGQVRLRREEVAMAAAGRSCKRAVKAGQKLSPAEMERLLADLGSARNPYTCPHGRPVFLTFDRDEVARLFGGRTCE